MPAVPLSVESNSNTSTFSEDPEREFTTLYQESEFTDVSGIAFTVLQEDNLKINRDEESDDIDQPLDEDDFETREHTQANLSRFNSSHKDQKILNRSNAYILQQKLMDLSKSNTSAHNQRNQKKQKPIGKVINNLRENKPLSKSNGHLPYQEKYQLKKDISKSFNNLQRQNINQSEKNVEKEHKNYHRYCHLSSSNYLYNNMTSVKQKPIYDREFGSLTDTKTQKIESGTGKRRSPPGSEAYITMNGNNNNNINGLKNNEKNNRFYGSYTKNGFTHNRMNEKNQMNSEESRKPLFITTVKSGKFLDPPPELAILLGLNHTLNDSVSSSTNGSSNSLNGSIRDRHQQQVLLYSFSSQPRVLHQHHHRAKCEAAAKVVNNRVRREVSNNSQDKADDGPVPYGNIMYDRRVVRGSTYAQQPMPTDGESQAVRQQEARRRAMARRRAQGQQARNARFKLRTPPPVPGRKHEDVQTENYLEEIVNRPPESDASCQTDLFLDRPETPVYVPAKVGLDAETQIYPGDLFDFDLEVQPILEVLVGKTVEQALIEVLEEEELAALRAQQRRFLELRAGEKAEHQRLEEQERRLREEKDRRLEQNKEATREQTETDERVAAAMFTQGYLADLLPNVLEGLKEAGYLIDDNKVGVEEGFMPWLMTEVTQEINQMLRSREILTDIVREILETRAEIYRVMGEDDAKELGLDSEEEEVPKPIKEEEEPVTITEDQTESMPIIRAVWE
ncbi:putative uncharacterized protein DDB_G0271606 [Periplaneta americana]|uniref:putative uncharacterized protein DDB_G0271606 n=1 Tax=Periplaneta americana TaxID=6978 RepID=UPI0037E754B0